MKNTIVVTTIIIALFTITANAQTSTDPLGNTWNRVGFGADEANYWDNQLGGIVTGGFNGTGTIQYALDNYYTVTPEGMPNRWGNGWVAKFIANLLAVRGYEFRSELSEAQQQQLEDVLVDAVNESTFVIDLDCGDANTTLGKWNSCSEDFVSYLALVARVKNFYPNVVSRVGINELNRIEQKYLMLTFTVNNGYYSLVKDQTLDGEHVIMRNHRGQSAVYTGLLLIYLNHALESYSRVGNPVPYWYKDATFLNTISDMFKWLQSVSTSDGVSYLTSCRYYSGGLVSCNDQFTAAAIPQIIPSGRLIKNLFGETMFSADKYSFLLFDDTYSAGNMNFGRKADYNFDNKEFSINWGGRPIRRHLHGPSSRPMNGPLIIEH